MGDDGRAHQRAGAPEAVLTRGRAHQRTDLPEGGLTGGRAYRRAGSPEGGLTGGVLTKGWAHQRARSPEGRLTRMAVVLQLHVDAHRVIVGEVELVEVGLVDGGAGGDVDGRLARALAHRVIVLPAARAWQHTTACLSRASQQWTVFVRCVNTMI